MRRANRLFGNKSGEGLAPAPIGFLLIRKLRDPWVEDAGKKVVWRDPCESLSRSDPIPTAPDNLLVDYEIASINFSGLVGNIPLLPSYAMRFFGEMCAEFQTNEL